MERRKIVVEIASFEGVVDVWELAKKYPKEEGYEFQTATDGSSFMPDGYLVIYKTRIETDEEFLKRARFDISALQREKKKKMEKEIVEAVLSKASILALSEKLEQLTAIELPYGVNNVHNCWKRINSF